MSWRKLFYMHFLLPVHLLLYVFNLLQVYFPFCHFLTCLILSFPFHFISFFFALNFKILFFSSSYYSACCFALHFILSEFIYTKRQKLMELKSFRCNECASWKLYSRILICNATIFSSRKDFLLTFISLYPWFMGHELIVKSI